MEATGVGTSSLSRLRRWNVGLAVLHGLQVVAVLVLANGSRSLSPHGSPKDPE